MFSWAHNRLPSLTSLIPHHTAPTASARPPKGRAPHPQTSAPHHSPDPLRFTPKRFRDPDVASTPWLRAAATDHDQAGFSSVDEEVPRSAQGFYTGPDMGPAQSKVPRPDARTEFRPCDAARPVRVARNVAQCSHDQLLIAKSSRLTELLMGPRHDAQDITLSSFRQPIAEHQSAVMVPCAARSPI